MLSPTSLIRAALRRTPLRPSVPVSAGASSSRPFSSTAARGTDSSDSANDHSALIRDLREADETMKARAQAMPSSTTTHQTRPFPRSFLEPSDFAMGRRVRDTKAVPRKFWKIGPSRADAEYHDVFRQLDINPLHEVMNSTLLSNFVSELGKIPSRAETKLTWRSQRKLGKAIRRAKMMGIIPLHSRRTLRPDRGL